MDDTGDSDGQLLASDGKTYLPPLHRIVMPKTTTQTALVKWLAKQGYMIKDISRSLNIRYQQVRNMVTTEPKRAAREDLPPDGIVLAEMEDLVDMLLGDELERTFEADRKQKRRAVKKANREGVTLDNDSDYTSEDDNDEEE